MPNAVSAKAWTRRRGMLILRLSDSGCGGKPRTAMGGGGSVPVGRQLRRKVLRDNVDRSTVERFVLPFDVDLRYNDGTSPRRADRAPGRCRAGGELAWR